jgi:hypothetical protein
MLVFGVVMILLGGRSARIADGGPGEKHSEPTNREKK